MWDFFKRQGKLVSLLKKKALSFFFFFAFYVILLMNEVFYASFCCLILQYAVSLQVDGKKTCRKSSRKLARRFAINHWGGFIYCLWQKCAKQLKPSSYSICHCQNSKPDELGKRRHNGKQNATQQPITCGRYCAGGCSSGASGTVMDGQWWQWKQSPHRKWMYNCWIVSPKEIKRKDPIN